MVSGVLFIEFWGDYDSDDGQQRCKQPIEGIRSDTSGHRCIGESMMMKTNMLDNRGLIGIIFDCKGDPKEILKSPKES
eukprot:scaffold17571_cov246-Skeletonema_marinoi.AAC.1